ncbi:MAG: hypothetical protein WBM84_03740 [Sedimenticolaceae bacterium]
MGCIDKIDDPNVGFGSVLSVQINIAGLELLSPVSSKSVSLTLFPQRLATDSEQLGCFTDLSIGFSQGSGNLPFFFLLPHLTEITGLRFGRGIATQFQLIRTDDRLV